MLTLVQRNLWILSAGWQELKPDAVVLVATVRALKYNGGVPNDELSSEKIWMH